MNKPYGFISKLNNFPWHDLKDEFEHDGIIINIANGIMTVSFDRKEDKNKAKEVAENYLKVYNFNNPHKITADFDSHSWEPAQQNIVISDGIQLNDRVKVQTKTHKVTLQGKAFIVTPEMRDSASFTNYRGSVSKVMKDETLSQALSYFSDQVIDNDKPLPGVYNCLEVIRNHLGNGKKGWEKLAQLAGKSDDYVKEITDTTHTDRHTNSRNKKLSDEECIERTKVIIQAYADSLIA